MPVCEMCRLEFQPDEPESPGGILTRWLRPAYRCPSCERSAAGQGRNSEPAAPQRRDSSSSAHSGDSFSTRFPVFEAANFHDLVRGIEEEEIRSGLVSSGAEGQDKPPPVTLFPKISRPDQAAPLPAAPALEIAAAPRPTVEAMPPPQDQDIVILPAGREDGTPAQAERQESSTAANSERPVVRIVNIL